MKYLLVAHPEPDGTIHIPKEWKDTRVDHAAHSGCCQATQDTCDALLQGTSVAHTILEIRLRLVTPCTGCTPSLRGVNALHHTRAVREWLARHNPQHGLIVGGTYLVKAVLVGICDELESYPILPGSAVLIEEQGAQRRVTFYKPRR